MRGYYDTPGTANSVVVSGTIAYLADGASGLRLVDVSNPDAPASIGSHLVPGDSLSLAIVGHYAYIGGTAGLRIANITNPITPTYVNHFYDYGGIHDLVIAGNFAYTLEKSDSPDSRLHILDITNRAAPASATITATPATTASATATAATTTYPNLVYLPIVLRGYIGGW